MNPALSAWLVLGISMLAEVAGTIALKHSDGFSRPAPALLAGCCYVAAVWLMAVAMRQLGMGLTYAVWAAGGTALTVLAGVALHGEPLSACRLSGLALVVLGVVVLNRCPG